MAPAAPSAQAGHNRIPGEVGLLSATLLPTFNAALTCESLEPSCIVTSVWTPSTNDFPPVPRRLIDSKPPGVLPQPTLRPPTTLLA
eukprot:CAMPEP_0194520054 /NCGR_PEP_ID=MMETSP0253-20130528/53920_1 /TAXON_ID=2966 /ORGANISM="Noctiluca scintillans" /LENGTH=85 /DNA_ID=CAMNT_0039364255 /DNA_START=15 /DNA_END=268 /DNA_ORIENTATION=-